jgi:DnaA family protein
MSRQLPLDLRWPAHQRFESYVLGSNVDIVESLRRVADERGDNRVFVAGGQGSGKTHLLIAVCAEASAQSRTAQYLDLARVVDQGFEAIRRFGGNDVLAIDNLDAIAGIDAAEHAVFDLYNRCVAEGTRLVFAATESPASLRIRLPDLISRLGSCTQWLLKPLDEGVRRCIVRDRASARGLQLDDVVLDWLFTRKARDLGTLIPLLDRIDRAALAAQRRVTLPFLRELLADSES